MRKTLWTLAFLFVAIEALAQPPNESALVKKLFDTGLYNLKTHEGQGAFVDAVVSTLHGKDARWVHLKKTAAQTNIHGHGEDSVLFLSPAAGQSTAVDFIGGAGGGNPQPGWIVDVPRYSQSDGLDPTKHGTAPPPAPQYPPYPFPETAVDGAGEALFSDFAEAGQPPNPQMFRFAFRVAYDWLVKNVPTLDDSIAKHRKEWRAILGLP